jgi:hypothetical protein
MPPGCSSTPYDEEHAFQFDLDKVGASRQAVDIFWTEDGRIFAVREDGSEYTLFADFEGDEDAAYAAVAKYYSDVYSECCAIAEELNKLRDVPTRPPVSWGEYWASLSDFLPEVVTGKEFRWEDEADVETFPEWCSDCKTWHSRAYAFDHGRDEDGLFIDVREWDGDDWDSIWAIYGDCSKAEFARFQHDYLTTDHYFIAWCEYFIWCADNGAVDPVDTYWKKELCTHADLIKSAREQLKYLHMGRKAD